MIALPRRARLAIVIAGLAFAAVLLLGPLNGTPWNERVFALALVCDATLLIAFLSRRPAFALAVPAIIFGGLQIAGALKFTYLTTPLLAPDLFYFLNRDLLDVATRYPSVMIALIGGVILIPGLMILAWRLDHPVLFAHVAPVPRRWVQTAGCCSPSIRRPARSPTCSKKACGRR
jgi:hypothetical protein